MSRLRLNKVADPSSPAANKIELYYSSTGLGTPAAIALEAIDESGNKALLAHFGILDYRLINVRYLTAGTSYVPTAGTRAILVEMVGGGGQGGGAPTSSTQVSGGSGGGGGAYAAKFLTGAAVKNPTTYQVGAGGTTGTTGTGQNGTASLWDTNVVVADFGLGGAAMAAGTTLITQEGTRGGLAANSTGDIKFDGGDGGPMVRLGSGANQGLSGDGGSCYFGEGRLGRSPVGGGVAGNAGNQYGGGGSGAATSGTAANGGAGANGLIRVWEFA